MPNSSIKQSQIDRFVKLFYVYNISLFLLFIYFFFSYFLSLQSLFNADSNFSIIMILQGIVLVICMSLFSGSVIALGAIVSAKPLNDLRYKGWTGDDKSFSSPYATSAYLGWAMASAISLIVTGVLPIVSWFSTYRFSFSSAVSVAIFTGNICQ